MANGNTPYSPLHSLSCLCNQTSFSSIRSPFSRTTAADARSRAIAKWTLSCVWCAHCIARSLFTWYLTSFVPNMAIAFWNAAEYRGSVVLAATRRREARSSAQASHSVAKICSGVICAHTLCIQTSFPHVGAPPTALPQTAVGCPCKKA